MLVIKIYMQDLTMSELQAVLLGELSTVAGNKNSESPSTPVVIISY